MKKNYLFLLIMCCLVSYSTAQKKMTGLNAYASGDWSKTGAMFDGQIGSMWQPEDALPGHYFIVDLGSVRNVVKLRILWDSANAKDYKLSFSTDNKTFTGELSYTNMAAGQREDVVDGLNINTRFIKFQGVTLQTQWAYGIYEFEVYEKTSDYYLEITPANMELVEGETMQFKVTAKDAVGNPITLTQPTTWGVTGGGTIDSNGLFTATTKGYYAVTATNGSAFIGTNIDVFPPASNLSLMGIVTASSEEPGFPAENVIDDIMSTHWSSIGNGAANITIDLGEKKNITDMILYWEAANPKEYNIEISDDNENWTTVQTFVNMPTGEGLNRSDRLYGINLNGRYVKMNTLTANTWWPYNIWEFRIFGGDFTSGVESVRSLAEVYPNPAADVLNFTEEISSCTLFSIDGKLIMKKENVKQLQIAGLEKGIYLISVTDKAGKNGFLKIQKL